MGQTQKVGTVATSVGRGSDGTLRVTYHGTVVVAVAKGLVVLRSGGWQTATTKLRMNQASAQFALGFSVSQRRFNWFVKRPDGTTVPFTEGMAF
jgi:hypothetical protein